MEAYSGLLLIGVVAFVILWAEGLLKRKTALFAAAGLLLAAMVLRGACMDYETLDYQNFLTKWVQRLGEQGGFRGLRYQIGNYNVPYLYFLALFSYSSIRDLYLIKLLSILFDVILAWGAARLVRCVTASDEKALAAFLVTLFLPTVILNGAYWGQCDSIYVAFAVWSLYFALDDKPVAAVCFIALSFAFKLQAVFLMPVFLLFLFARKMKWWHLLFFPLTYIVVILPAVLLGRPFKSTLLFYLHEATSAGDALNYNSASVFAFFRGAENPDQLARYGILAAFVFLLLLYVLCFLRRRQLSDRALLVCALLIAVAVPYLLPHMHDRYFYLADILSVAFAFQFVTLLHVPVCVSFGSLMGYHAYLTGRWFLDKPQSMAWGAAALALVLLTLIVTLTAELTWGSEA
jgi:Gpi18-like mannosyltransferase